MYAFQSSPVENFIRIIIAFGKFSKLFLSSSWSYCMTPLKRFIPKAAYMKKSSKIKDITFDI